MKTNRIESLSQLSASHPTTIRPDTEVTVPGCYIDFDGNGEMTAKGARWTLRDAKTDARMRDLVVGSRRCALSWHA